MNEMNNDFLERLKVSLKNLIPGAKFASGRRAINCRCFYCPDSSDPKSKHGYILFPDPEEGGTINFYCHKCHTSVVVNNKTLSEWGIGDQELAIELANYNKQFQELRSTKGYFNKKSKKFVLSHNYISNQELSFIKLDRLNQRLGSNFTFDDVKRLKINLNLYDLLNENQIKVLTRDPKVVQQLNDNFLGFISIDNSYINMRRLCDEGLLIPTIDKRYVNYKLFDNNAKTSRFYTIPMTINLVRPERIKIHIAEGPFDILSVYNLRGREEAIYTSIAGSNYADQAIYFAINYQLPYIELHYYPDNDKLGSDEVMRKVASQLSILRCPIYIHRNMMQGEKDFGVSPDRIKEKIYQIN